AKGSGSARRARAPPNRSNPRAPASRLVPQWTSGIIPTSILAFPNHTMRRQFLLVFALAVAAGTRARAQQPNDSLYDIVIRNGRVLDGEGNPWIAADVAIKGGRFVKVGRVFGHGKTELD